eukprot:s2053_g2.t1
MSFAATEVARDVSSFLIPHQSSEDLVLQGISAREARRRSFFRTCLMERLSTLIQLILIWAILFPAMVPLLLSLSLLVAAVCDAIDQGTAAVAITNFLFGHLDDSCEQPLGLCVMIFWISVASKGLLIFLWNRCQSLNSDCCTGPTGRCLTASFYGSLATITVLFEVIWPVTTFIMLLLAQNCTSELRASTWVVLSPFFLEAFCCCPILWCAQSTRDPAELVENFTRIRFDPETFNDEIYATNCAICLSDFAAADDIVLVPCAPARHVFHEGCLADWLRTAQTCPLCRTPLNPAFRSGRSAEIEQALAS